MKISHRLLALSGFSAAGLVCVAGVSYFAVTSIQTDLQSLTTQAAPLQSKTYALQERTERALGRLLKLSLARDTAEATQAGAAADTDLKAIEQLRSELQALDPKAVGPAVDFRASQTEIGKAVAQRLADTAAYKQDTEAARQQAEINAARAAAAPSGGAAATPARTGSGYEHTVARGQTLSEIARGYGKSIDSIMKASKISNPSHIRVGQVLFIPD